MIEPVRMKQPKTWENKDNDLKGLHKIDERFTWCFEEIEYIPKTVVRITREPWYIRYFYELILLNFIILYGLWEFSKWIK